MATNSSTEEKRPPAGHTSARQMKELGLTCRPFPDQNARVIDGMEETRPFSTDEMKRAKCALSALSVEEQGALSMDLLTKILYGYWTYPKQPGDTIHAVRSIARFRLGTGGFNEGESDFLPSHGIAHIFGKMVPNAAKISKACGPRRVFGQDKFGHLLNTIRISEVLPAEAVALSKIPGGLEAMKFLQCQMNEAMIIAKREASMKCGHRLLKNTLIVDLGGLSIAHVGSEFRSLMGIIIGMGQSYYPYSIWRIYFVNAPFLFRAAYAAVSQFMHPLTRAKVITLSSTQAAAEEMLSKDGIGLDQLPVWMGGSHPGYDVLELVRKEVKCCQQRQLLKEPRPETASMNKER